MIGEEQFLGKGLSHLIIEAFLKSECHHAAAIITDPETRNNRGIRCYEKAGFEKVGIFVHEEGAWAGRKHTLMMRHLATRNA